jgi:uncharacterized protein DUF4430
MNASRAPVATVDNVVDWGGALHDPARQANDRIRIAVGVATVWDVLDAAVLRPPLAPTSQGNGERLYVTGIGGVEQNPDTGYYWVYLVDGNEPPVGPDAFVLRGGERIVWSYVHCSSGRKQATHPGF